MWMLSTLLSPLGLSRSLKRSPSLPKLSTKPWKAVCEMEATKQLSFDFLTKKPYAPPSWASHLSPIPSHVFSLAHVCPPPTIPSLLFSISNSTGFRFWVLFSSTLLLKIEWFWLLNRCLLLFISGIFLIYPKTLNSGLRYFPFLSLFYLPIWFLYNQVHSFYLQYWFWLIISTYLIYQTLSLAFLEQTLRRGELVRMK